MVTSLMSFRIAAFGLSNIGLVRQNNEDVWAELPDENFYVIADGMGGHQAGEVASREAVNYLCRLMKKILKHDSKHAKSLTEVRDLLHQAIQIVNEKIYCIGSETETLRGMGTTLCCIAVHPQGLIYAHVGDSRIYRLRNKKLELLTKDHSLLRELVDMGQISEDQAMDFLYKNIITKAIGTEPTVEPPVEVTELKAGDIYLMCTDGLTDLLRKKEIEEILNKNTLLPESAQQLIQQANERGGHDNITVLLIALYKSHEKTDLSR